MKKFKDFKIVIIIMILLMLFAGVRFVIKSSAEEETGISVGSYNIDMYIKYKNGDIKIVDSAPKEGNYEITSKCEGAKITWNNETHTLTMSLKNNLENCEIVFNEI